MKKLIIIANWKCNPTTLAEAKQLFNSVEKGIKAVKNAEVVICPPFVYLAHLKISKLQNFRLGGQDVFWEEKGAYTGEVSALMLKDLGCEYVIVGHSERRKWQNETDEIINKKIKAALKVGLKVILCVDKIIQLRKDLKDMAKEEFKNLILAYEPLFAIGTGRPCNPKKAEKMRNFILKEISREIPILYGGSVNLQNAQDYIKTAGFSGLLVGGASLKADEFVKIVNSLIFF